MNKQELIKNIRKLSVYGRDLIEKDEVLNLVNKLDEPEAGHADKAPRYVKNVLARLRELPLHDREVWLNAIIGEFEQDFSHEKWREGYEQGKFEGAMIPYDEPEKAKVPQFVADWIEEAKKSCETVVEFFGYKFSNIEMIKYLKNKERINLVARAWLDGYEVEKEKKYKITLLNRNDGDLYLINQNADLADKYGHFSPVVLLFTKGTNFSEKCYKLTKKEVVLNDFGWVFDCPGIKIEEVKDE